MQQWPFKPLDIKKKKKKDPIHTTTRSVRRVWTGLEVRYTSWHGFFFVCVCFIGFESLTIIRSKINQSNKLQKSIKKSTVLASVWRHNQCQEAYLWSAPPDYLWEVVQRYCMLLRPVLRVVYRHKLSESPIANSYLRGTKDWPWPMLP